MTEQEAINMMRYRVNTATEIAGKGEEGNAFEDINVAVIFYVENVLIKNLIVYNIQCVVFIL